MSESPRAGATVQVLSEMSASTSRQRFSSSRSSETNPTFIRHTPGMLRIEATRESQLRGLAQRPEPGRTIVGGVNSASANPGKLFLRSQKLSEYFPSLADWQQGSS